MIRKAKRSLKKVICAGISILFITACAKATLVNSNSIVQDGIEYYIQTDKAVYNLGENVDILYRVTNLTENSIDIGMVLNCYYAYVNLNITQDVNIDIWENCRVVPPCGYIMLTLEPQESKESQQIWNMMNDNLTLSTKDDFPVGPGLYNIMGELRLDGGYERVPVSVSIEIIPEPCSLVLLGAGFMGIILVRKKRRSGYERVTTILVQK